MKSVDRYLRDKWILDSGAKNHMTENSRLLDCTTCLVFSIFVYLGGSDRLMTTQIGSFKSPQISFPIFEVPGLNLSLTSCAQLCADMGFWIVLHGTRGIIYDKEESSYGRLKFLKTYPRIKFNALSLVTCHLSGNKIKSTSGIG